ncbi:MAG: TolC family outer membrane protein [Halofilum sp. (in: g-proteobacteria)]|nr:TolC family outer membrane protein [Halofilum sp. (in: g-proteobacteria)]
MPLNRALALGVTGALSVLACLPVHAGDLLQVYQQARENDPQYATARAEYRAAREAAPQARAAVLPQVAISYGRFENEEESGDGTSSDFTSTQAQLELRQTLFDWSEYAGLGRADALVAEAEATLAGAEQDLIIRVSEAYFDVLSARDNLRFARAEKKAIGRQLEQARERFDVGLIAVTDVKEAQASYDLAVSREIEAANRLDNARESLRTITGSPPGILSGIAVELALDRPDPEDPATWVDRALEQNPDYLAARSAAETARYEIKQARSGHYPSVDLVARHSEQETQFAGNIPSDTETDSIGVELQWTLFAGGGTWSQSDQARARFQAAQSRVVSARRNVEQSVRNVYRSLMASISQVRALQQAVESNQAAVEATRAGFRVGTRTAVDVLNVLRDLYQAQRDFADARYRYVVNRLRLEQATGTLTVEDVRQVNSWLGENGSSVGDSGDGSS